MQGRGHSSKLRGEQTKILLHFLATKIILMPLSEAGQKKRYEIENSRS